jgi:hypothetical protein
VSGRIVRISAERVALCFESVPPAIVRIANEMIAASRVRHGALAVVLIDEQPERRAVVAEAFRRAGCTVVEAPTALAAIVTLGGSDFEPDLIAVANSTPAGPADDMRTFVARNHPAATLVTIADELAEPAELAQWLSAAGPESELHARIHELLAAPRRS